MLHPDDQGFTYATDADWDREGARERGFEDQGSAWILSDRDVWYQNPFYQGPPQPHPESDGEECHARPYPAPYPTPVALYDDDMVF